MQYRPSAGGVLQNTLNKISRMRERPRVYILGNAKLDVSLVPNMNTFIACSSCSKDAKNPLMLMISYDYGRHLT